MKTILCFGDSNVWGAIPGDYNPETGLSGRFDALTRWTGILQSELGGEYHVIDDGISARTTNLDEIVPGRPYKNGFSSLPICLEAHYPIDLVVFWIGTNDTKIQYNRSALEISEGVRTLVQAVACSNKGPTGNAPNILLIAPQPAQIVDNMNPQMDTTSVAKTAELAACYQVIARDEKCAFFDAAEHVVSSQVDGVHLDAASHAVLGRAIARVVKKHS